MNYIFKQIFSNNNEGCFSKDELFDLDENKLLLSLAFVNENSLKTFFSC